MPVRIEHLCRPSISDLLELADPAAVLAVLAVPALFVLASCGTDDGLGKRYPVSGTVTYNGNPLEKGEISFVTEDLTKNFGATGIITNGSYTLSTGGNGDGAQVGKYKVTISAKEDYIAKAQADFQKETGRQSQVPPEFHRKSRGGSQEPHPRRLRRCPHHDPHGRGQAGIEHNPLQALRRRRAAGAAEGHSRERPRPQRTVSPISWHRIGRDDSSVTAACHRRRPRRRLGRR